jgi:hypothetical protein
MNDKYNQLLTVSNPKIVYNNLQKYFGRPTELYISSRKNKKYYIINPYNNKEIHFGSLLHRDYTFTRDKTKQKSYLARSGSIPGNWRDDPYSPNNISRSVLWDIL